MKQYVITRKQHTGANAVALYMSPAHDSTGVFYAAGQYLVVGFRRGRQRTPVRCFSATTSPLAGDELGIAFRKTGLFTAGLAALNVGDTVELEGPFGDFTVPANETRPLMLLAGGIGITPMLSILRDLELRQFQAPVTLLYSVRSLQDVPFASELLELARRNKNLTVRFVAWDTTGSSGNPMVLPGKITRELIKEYTVPYTQYYICGPGGYADSIDGMLAELDVYEEAIHNESFSQSSKIQIAGFAVQKLIYGTLAAAVIVGVGLLFAKDLVGAQEHATTVTTTNSGASGTDTSTQYTTNTSGASSSTSQQQYYAPQQTYQSPHSMMS